MNKIKFYSFYAACFLDFMLMILPIYIITQWIFIQQIIYYTPGILSSVTIDNITITLDQVTWNPLTQFLGCCAELIEFIAFWGILYCLSKIFHRYKIGEIFSLYNAKFYYTIGKLLFIDALLAQPISDALWSIAITYSNPVGHRMICVSLGSPNIMAIMIGLLVIFISWIMIEGSKIEEEQQLII